jgi:hypothetical protein
MQQLNILQNTSPLGGISANVLGRKGKNFKQRKEKRGKCERK